MWTLDTFHVSDYNSHFLKIFDKKHMVFGKFRYLEILYIDKFVSTIL